MNYQSYNRLPKGLSIQQLMQMLPQRPQQLAHGGSPYQSYVNQGTGAGGRDDNIDAKLSENEYVLDAEFMALLGDGNPDAGAKKMDKFRENVRKHKGKYLTHGQISPDALDPMEYISI